MNYPRSAVVEQRHTVLKRPGTLVSLLRERAATEGDVPLYEFLEDGEDRIRPLTAGELDLHARHVGALLQAQGAQGSRAIVLMPPGIDFITAFFGCIYAGVVAVPASPPESEGAVVRLEGVLRDAGARYVLTSPSLRATIARRFADRGVTVLAPGAEANDCASDWMPPILDGDSLAYLQYTPGPFGSPRGVMVTHANLLHNAEVIRQAIDLTPNDRVVTWLDPYHEMGLIAGILQPLYVGCSSVLMSPAHFLQRPFRWLRAVSRHRATVTTSPNFGYDLCVRRITSDQRAGLDLSCLRVALNGTEPVEPSTLAEFSQAFAPHGFDPLGFCPFYGLPEATLLVAGCARQAAPVVGVFDPRELDAGVARIATARNGRLIASCGRPRPGQVVRIVEPHGSNALEPGEVGEIWVGGPSVSHGFWRRRAETMESFGAFIRDTGEGPFLRTGDLGFIVGGELFVTGGLEDGRRGAPGEADHAAALDGPFDFVAK